MNKKNKQVRQQDAYQANAGGAVTTVQDPRPLFKGNIFVADCMPLILAYSKLYGSVECKWCMTKWRSRASSLDVNNASISPAINKDPLMRDTAMLQWISRLSHMLLPNTTKVQHSFAYSGLRCRPVTYIFRKLSWS